MDKQRIINAFRKKKPHGLTLIPYDRAAWHSEEVRDIGLPPLAAYIHSGMLLGWAVERDLLALPVKEKLAEHIAKFKQQCLSPAELFEVVGGVLEKEYFSASVRRFLDAYYDDYLKDYRAVVQPGESDYHVEESRTNISNVSSLLDQKFLEFKSQEEEKSKLERESSNNPLIYEALSVFVLLGSPAKDPPWLSSEWPKYFERLKPIVDESRGRSHFETIQLEGKKIAKFGRLNWSDDTERRWTHEASASRKFFSLSLSCPSLAVCLKEKEPTDFHLHISNELIYYPNPYFNPTITLVVRETLKNSLKHPIEKTVCELASLMQAVLVVQGERTFARSLPRGGLVNCLNDQTGLVFRGGNHQQEPPSLNLFDESWASWAPFVWKLM